MQASVTLPIRFAVREVDITPPIGIHIRNWSASNDRQASGIHRPLIGKVLALASDRGRALLVALDLGWWMSREDEAALREPILRSTGLRAHEVIVSLTHTHAGPSLSRADENQPGGKLIAPWLDGITAEIVLMCRQALASMEPGVLEFETGDCDLASNRDLPMPDSTVACGYNPDKPAPKRLLIGRVSDTDGLSRVIVAHYAAHPTSLGPGNTLISPDYVGAARELVEKATGAMFVFLQGPSGDLAPREQYSDDPSIADKNGRVLGHATLAILERMLPPGTAIAFDRVLQSGAPLALTALVPSPTDRNFETRTIPLVLPAKPNEPPEDKSVPVAVAADRAQRARRVVEASRGRGGIAFDITFWRFGDVVFVALPGEAFSELQSALQEEFQDYTVAVVNLANGPHSGYLAPASAYEDNRYQSWQSPLDGESFERVRAVVAVAIAEERSRPQLASDRYLTAKEST